MGKGKRSSSVDSEVEPDWNDKLTEFQMRFLESLPSQKEMKSHKKKTQKAYSMFLEQLDEATWLDSIEEQSKVPRLWLFWLCIAFLFLVTVLSFFVRFMGIFMTRFLGFVYPVYASIKALLTERKDDDTQWLMYWVVYASFAIFEQVFLEQSKVLPVYFSVKMVFLFWCQFLNGAELLYKILIYPWVRAIKAITG